VPVLEVGLALEDADETPDTDSVVMGVGALAPLVEVLEMVLGVIERGVCGKETDTMPPLLLTVGVVKADVCVLVVGKEVKGEVEESAESRLVGV
jgi:hypothetical protein